MRVSGVQGVGLRLPTTLSRMVGRWIATSNARRVEVVKRWVGGRTTILPWNDGSANLARPVTCANIV